MELRATIHIQEQTIWVINYSYSYSPTPSLLLTLYSHL